MRDWKHTIDIKKHFVDKNVTAQVAAQGVHKELGKLTRLKAFKDDDELLGIAQEFERLGEDPDAETQEFDEALERLYDWADANDVWLGL